MSQVFFKLTIGVFLSNVTSTFPIENSMCPFDFSAAVMLAAGGLGSLRDRKIHHFCVVAVKIDNS